MACGLQKERTRLVPVTVLVALIILAAMVASCGGSTLPATSNGTTSAASSVTSSSLSPSGTVATVTPASTSATSSSASSTVTTLAAAGSGDGKALFASTCTTCHGTDLKGAVGPKLAGRFSEPDLGYIQTHIKFGGTRMPAFGGRLSDDEIVAISRYVVTVK
jgi:mono/diheme cytochrome c family protein